MPSTDAVITQHINQARDRIDHARRQHAAATEQDRPAWQLQLDADGQALTVLLELQDQVRLGADPAALSERRREELRTAAEAADPDAMHYAYERGVAGGVAHHATFMRALAPFTAMAQLHSDLWKASRTVNA